ncbi:ankyrin repeat and socs box protein 13 [Plakobranchus ocellatus]|uniref:Ankyrin repeat and socs box protein 13 n=1 Tax=Plakobranchus ocellatus TaxID=259542 RepID=A0AAV4DIC8_9GAST|nr:ankyrin repeat and socs box protein 13 [Plakobranchus ocellatus]
MSEAIDPCLCLPPSPVESYPLHKAAREGRYKDLKKLLDSGKHDVNLATFELVRPLHEACLAGQFECTALLIKYGADVNLRNIDGATALCDACSNGCILCVQLLLENGANVNPPFLLTTPVHESVLKDNWACLKLLLEYGASLDKSDCHFGTPLHVAACKGHLKSAMILLQAGASPNVSKTHQTPLHLAARSQDLDLIKLLLEYGADVYAQDSRSKTASQLVPSSTSHCKTFLHDWERTPKSLHYHCRLTIRSAVGPARLRYLSELQLPKALIRFLQHYVE